MRVSFALLRFSLHMLVVGCAQTTRPAATVETAQAARVEVTEALEARVRVATQLREALLLAIEREDAPRKGKVKALLVSSQVRAEAEALTVATPALPYSEAGVQAYEDAGQELVLAYLASLLESTDPASQPLPWSSDENRDVLGSPTVDAKLALWQARDPARSLIKFAVVRAADGESLDVRVGAFDVGHVDIAGGPALSAGLLQTSVIDGKTRVVAFENTSGGFRPGPLRNRTTRVALLATGYLSASSDVVTIYDNPSGGYADSKLLDAAH